MNAKSNGTRAWRQKRKRAVSPIIATILLVAITVVLAAVLYILISGLTKGPGNTPLGTALALGTPSEAKAGAGATTNNYYNMSVQSASGGLILSNLGFQVVTASGSVVPAGATWVVNVLSISGTVLGTYTFSTGLWTGSPGGTQLVTTSQTFSLNAVGASSLNAQGDLLKVVATGSFQGSISVTIP